MIAFEAAVIEVVLTDREGFPLTPADIDDRKSAGKMMLSAIMTNPGPILGLALLAWLLSMAGAAGMELVFLATPSLVARVLAVIAATAFMTAVAAFWFVAWPVAFAECTGFAESLQRSLHLTRNNRGRVLVLTALTLLGPEVVDFLLERVEVALSVSSLTKLVHTTLVMVFGSLISATAAATTYSELRALKETAPAPKAGDPAGVSGHV